MKETVYRIKDKLDKIAQKDKKYKTFGSERHQYQLHPPLSIQEIEQLEKEHQCVLPEDYKLFLTMLGNGGVGPDYGLYPLKEALQEATLYSTSTAKKIPQPWNLNFPFSNLETQQFIQHYHQCMEDGEDEKIQYFNLPETLTGVIFLAEVGCDCFYVLVVKGEQAGTVWWYGEEMIPCWVKNEPLTFLTWYEGWIDRSLEELSPKQHPKSVEKTAILNYDGWDLETLPEEVTENIELKKLVLSRNKFKTFPSELTQCKQLKTLDVSMNPFTEVSEEIGELKELKNLYLSYNYLTNLPNSIKNLKKLQELKMVYSYKLETVPTTIVHLTQLKQLSFAHSYELKNLPENLGELKNIEELHLQGCKNLTLLPNSIGNLSKLKVLNIDDTSLEMLPETFSQLIALEELRLGSDVLKLEETINIINTLPKLKYLTLSNQLTFSDKMATLSSVQYLTLKENYHLWHKGYKKLPLSKFVATLPHLEMLSVGGNHQLSELPENIGELKHLKQLYLAHTQIKTFPESMKNLTNLTLIEVNLAEKKSDETGVSHKEKTKLEKWFPNAKIRVW